MGSKRLRNKNILKLNEYPLLAYSINVALKSKVYSHIFCITDSIKYRNIAIKYGANFFTIRPKFTSTSKASDDQWVKWAISECENKNIDFDYFSILRPTSPFRTIEMIKKSLTLIKRNKEADSVRAVEKTKIHPGKIWKIKNNKMLPILKKCNKRKIPWHSCQYADLPTYYAQNASLETIKKKSFKRYKLISGKKIIPLITNSVEGFDINTKIDYEIAKIIIQKKPIKISLKK